MAVDTKKISELPTAGAFNDDDFIQILQGGANKKIKKVDAGLGGGGGGGGDDISGKMDRTTNQSIPNNSKTPITFDAELFDTDDIVDIGGNPTRLKATTAGKYMIYANMSFTGNSSGLRLIAFRKNGTVDILEDSRPTVASPNFTTMAVSGIFDLSALDYIEVEVNQDSGGNLDIVSNAIGPHFGMAKILG